MKNQFENLKELIQLISINRFTAIEGVFDTENDDLKIIELYNILKDGKNLTDGEAYKILYGCTGHEEAYKKLKTRLKDKLMNALLFVDTSNQSIEYLYKMVITVGKNYSIMKVLLTYGAKNLACEIGEKTLRLCLKYELNDYGLMFSRYLRRQYGFIRHNKQKYKYYNALTIRLEKIFLAESKSEEYYTEISTNYVTKKDLNPQKALKKLVAYTEELQKEIPNIDSYKYCKDTYQLLTYRYSLEKNHLKVIETVQEAKAYLKKKKFSHGVYEFSFNHDLVVAYNALNQIDKSIQISVLSKDLVAPQTLNWFIIQNILFTLYMYKQNWQEALNVLIEVKNNKKLLTFEHYRQIFSIKEAYLFFLIDYNLINPLDPDSTSKLKFRLNKFLNDVPMYNKDKGGLNLAIKLIELLFLFGERKYAAITEKLSAFSQYQHRYLKNDETLRYSIFIKMLLSLPESKYNPIRVQRQVAKLHDRLLNAPKQITENTLDVEVIPYEVLWEYIIKLLKKKKRKLLN